MNPNYFIKAGWEFFNPEPLYLSALIRNYGHVLAVIFFYHRDTEDTEDIIPFAHRKTAMNKKTCAFGNTITA
jgi:hypothetical protein